jgi:F-type H+-transporting ATPase subunit b
MVEIVENVALISINATLVVQLVSFLLFMILLNRIMIRPLRKMMTERALYLEKVRQEIQAAHEGYTQIGRKIQDQETETRQAAFKIREEMEREAQESASDAVARTKSEIETLRKESQRQADEKIAAARQQIDREANVLADQMIAALLDRGVPS